MATDGDGSHWNTIGWQFLRGSTIVFALLGFIGAAAAVIGSGGMRFNGVLVEGWRGVWLVTAGGVLAGFLFGLIGLLIFKTLAIASR